MSHAAIISSIFKLLSTYNSIAVLAILFLPAQRNSKKATTESFRQHQFLKKENTHCVIGLNVTPTHFIFQPSAFSFPAGLRRFFLHTGRYYNVTFKGIKN